MCYVAVVPNTPSSVPHGERAKFFDHDHHRSITPLVVVMDGPFDPPLWVIWLNGTVDCPLKRFLTLGLVSGALKGRPLGLMAPYPACTFGWPLLQPRDSIF